MDRMLERRLQLKRRVLVVDDEVINRRILEKIISEKYEVLHAGDGEEALKIIKENRHILCQTGAWIRTNYTRKCAGSFI